MYEKCIRERLETKNKTEDDIINVKDKKKKKKVCREEQAAVPIFSKRNLKLRFLAHTQVYACLHMENACLIMVSQNCCVFHRPML